MAYTNLQQITMRIPAPVLNDALDDNRDGMMDAGAVDALIATASAEVDGYLQGLFSVPFLDPAPSKVASAALAFCCEMIYARRSVPADQNPYTKLAAWWRDHLQKVGNRELPFDAAISKAFVPGAAITDNLGADVQST